MAPLYSYVDHRVAGWYYPWMMGGAQPTSGPLEQKMRLVKSLGYHGLGTSWWDLVCYYQERGSLAQIRQLSVELGLPLTGFTFVVEGWAFSKGDAQKNAVLLAKSSLDLACAAGCPSASLVAPFDSGDLRDAARTFRELAHYAEHLGLRLALEFIGITPQLKNIRAARDFLELVDVKSAGMAIDSYHFFAGQSSFSDLEAVPVSDILAVHLADGPSDLSDPSIDFHRNMPGEGKQPLGDFVKALAAKGFNGYWHLECINGDDYASEMDLVAERGLRLMKNVVEKSLPC
jgi:4-hydroxyphenylpyruvate dioxygenase